MSCHISIRKFCENGKKALSKGEYESSVNVLDTKALPNVGYENLALQKKFSQFSQSNVTS